MRPVCSDSHALGGSGHCGRGAVISDGYLRGKRRIFYEIFIFIFVLIGRHTFRSVFKVAVGHIVPVNIEIEQIAGCIDISGSSGLAAGVVSRFVLFISVQFIQRINAARPTKQAAG